MWAGLSHQNHVNRVESLGWGLERKRACLCGLGTMVQRAGGRKSTSAPHHHWQHMWLGTGLEGLNGLEEDVCVVKGRARLTVNSEKQEGGLGSWFYKNPVSRSDSNIVTKALDKDALTCSVGYGISLWVALSKKKKKSIFSRNTVRREWERITDNNS